ncbi:hypothetical protein D3C72_2159080 [compost metagenome]
MTEPAIHQDGDSFGRDARFNDLMGVRSQDNDVAIIQRKAMGGGVEIVKVQPGGRNGLRYGMTPGGVFLKWRNDNPARRYANARAHAARSQV